MTPLKTKHAHSHKLSLETIMANTSGKKENSLLNGSKSASKSLIQDRLQNSLKKLHTVNLKKIRKHNTHGHGHHKHKHEHKHSHGGDIDPSSSVR